jgi:hypothetical protein
MSTAILSPDVVAYERDDDEFTGLHLVSPATHPARDARYSRAITAARKNLLAAEQQLRDAVADARAAGDSWTIIGAALETTRQNAYQRFGRG